MYIGPSVFRRPCILTALHPTWLLQAFCLLFHKIPEPWGKGFDSDSSSSTECSKVSYSLLAAQRRTPVLVWSLSLFLCRYHVVFTIIADIIWEKGWWYPQQLFLFLKNCFSFHFYTVVASISCHQLFVPKILLFLFKWKSYLPHFPRTLIKQAKLVLFFLTAKLWHGRENTNIKF